ncbi:programmed cell death protein 2 [Chelonus insularis]|uniref:programmed cell death protein 2 n=1 Tax=Chelonus insularis TaxID=460826 RepID=UPI001589555D|nr:programmed cell death protein 2 [Chelonus insularis]
MDEVEIGFVEECDSWRLSSRFFVSKVGGKPAWLDLKKIPTAKDVECRNCGNPCVFLCQIYAALDQPNAFHRQIFIFICRDFNCCELNSNKNVRVLRSQLPRENDYYPFDPPIEEKSWRPDIDASSYGPMCRVCFLRAPHRCAKCKNVNYCSKHHQVLDWKAGHKKECSEDAGQISSTPGLLFLEYKIAIESENYEGSEDEEEENDFEKEKREIEKFKMMVKNGQAGTLADADEADLMKMTVANEDETFLKFQETVKKHPDQILRYQRGGKPLWISAENQLKDIPKCENCNQAREFEFQVMPQLLNYLNFNDVLKSLDWGVLTIFTCKNSCDIESGFQEEFIWKQDIVS